METKVGSHAMNLPITDWEAFDFMSSRHSGVGTVSNLAGKFQLWMIILEKTQQLHQNKQKSIWSINFDRKFNTA